MTIVENLTIIQPDNESVFSKIAKVNFRRYENIEQFISMARVNPRIEAAALWLACNYQHHQFDLNYRDGAVEYAAIVTEEQGVVRYPLKRGQVLQHMRKEKISRFGQYFKGMQTWSGLNIYEYALVGPLEELLQGDSEKMFVGIGGKVVRLKVNTWDNKLLRVRPEHSMLSNLPAELETGLLRTVSRLYPNYFDKPIPF